MGGSSRSFPSSRGCLTADVRDAVSSVPHQAVVLAIIAQLLRAIAARWFGAYPVRNTRIRCFPLKKPRDAAGCSNGERQCGPRNRGKDWAASGTDEEGRWVPIFQQRPSCEPDRSRKLSTEPADKYRGSARTAEELFSRRVGGCTSACEHFGDPEVAAPQPACRHQGFFGPGRIRAIPLKS